MRKFYEMSTVPRTIILWVSFTIVLWSVFSIGLWTHPEAWQNIPVVERETGWNVFWFIIRNNCLLLLLIMVGNLFVRFGAVTPGLIVLVLQAVIIGWTAGTNSFMEPFASVAAANAAFLRIGLWETNAYVLVCAATISRSLHVADTFPASKWSKVTPIKDLRLSLSEWVFAGLGLLALLGAAYFEAFTPV